MNAGPDGFPWLFAAPIAHRGLHDRKRGIVENTPSAAKAAVARGFGIECDVQLTRDGEAVVFHDFVLDRLTEASGPLVERTASELATIALRGTTDRIMPLREFLELVDGTVPVTIEIKSAFDGDLRLADRTLAIAGAFDGPVALKSFDPEIIAHLRTRDIRVPLGIVSEAEWSQADWPNLPDERRHALANFLHYTDTRPDFLSWRVRDLPHAVPYLCRTGLRLPVMSWTVRTPEQAHHARRWADQIVFEGFDPTGAE